MIIVLQYTREDYQNCSVLYFIPYYFIIFCIFYTLPSHINFTITHLVWDPDSAE